MQVVDEEIVSYDLPAGEYTYQVGIHPLQQEDEKDPVWWWYILDKNGMVIDNMKIGASAVFFENTKRTGAFRTVYEDDGCLKTP